MNAVSPKSGAPPPVTLTVRRRQYRQMLRRTTARLLLTYLAPFLVLTAYFFVQSDKLLTQSRRLHLKSVAEYQANTLDLFFKERLVNLSNAAADPKLTPSSDYQTIEHWLGKLRDVSDAFVDLGLFDSSGIQVSYAGPFHILEHRDYSREKWFRDLLSSSESHVITDVYLGFRRKPHYTLAVARRDPHGFLVLKATLDPEKIYSLITSVGGAEELSSFLVNLQGVYQLVTPHLGSVLESSAIVPPRDPALGIQSLRVGGERIVYGYKWLQIADWALVVQTTDLRSERFLAGMDMKIIGVALAVLLGLIVVIFIRARKVASAQVESDLTRAQLEHAAKLASVGELAAGIAHEINNPLAIISEESGLMRDLMNPEFGQNLSPQDLCTHLEAIHDAVFRCRDITRKLLGFVRKTEFNLKIHDIHKLLDEVLEGFITKELEVSNITIRRDFGTDVPRVLTDRNQLEQVIINLINNAVDAIEGRAGEIRVTTRSHVDWVKITITDTGKGMTQEQLGKIFLPFYTTKEVGKGTGLGLSVSWGIIRGMGGRIEVESSPGKGSSFSIWLSAASG